MAIDNPVNWYLKKHESGEIFGPIALARITEWARSAQVNSQDRISNDKVAWTPAPMIPELNMDWLVVLGEDLLYGPTTEEAVLEFFRLEEIHEDTEVINCCTGLATLLKHTLFFQSAPPEPEDEKVTIMNRLSDPGQGDLRENLQQKIRDLENSLVDRNRRLRVAEETIARLEAKIKDLEPAPRTPPHNPPTRVF